METAEDVGIFNLSTLCRCCHADADGQFKRLDVNYNFGNGSEIFTDLLRDVFGICMYSSGPEYSYSICDACIGDLRSAAQFKNQVVNCERRFHEYCLNEQFNLEIVNIKDELKDDDIKEEEDIKVDPEAYEDDGAAHYDDNNFDAAHGVSDAQGNNEGVINEDLNNTQTKESKSEVKLKRIRIKSNVKTNKGSKSEIKPKKGNKSEVRTKKGSDLEVKPRKGSDLEVNPKKGSNLEVKSKKGSKSEVKPKKEITKKTTKGTDTKITLRQKNLYLLVRHGDLTDTSIICRGCCKNFPTIHDFKSHVNTAHSKSLYTCKECSKTKKNFHEFKMHVSSHELKKNWCYYCDLNFPNTIQRKEHETRIHDLPSLKYVCDVCNKEFLYKCSLKKHVQLHYASVSTAKKFMCDICGLRIADATNLKSHKMAVHERIKRFKCDSCDAMFLTNKLLKFHMFTHKGTKPAKCVDCRRSFLTEEGLRKHQEKFHSDQEKFHGDQTKPQSDLTKYECPFCNKILTKYRSYKSHINNHEHPHPCEVCGKVFVGKYSYNRHKLNKHTKGIDTRPFQCDVCLKKFTTKHVMLRHIASLHNPDRKDKIKVKCDVCKLPVADLEGHMKNHVIRPFRCKLCGKTYPAKNALNRHLQTHDNDSTFDCDLCPKKFKRVRGLERHKMKIHGVKVPKRELNNEFNVEEAYAM